MNEYLIYLPTARFIILYRNSVYCALKNAMGLICHHTLNLRVSLGVFATYFVIVFILLVNVFIYIYCLWLIYL